MTHAYTPELILAQEIEQHIEVALRIDTVRDDVVRVAALLQGAVDAGGRIFFFGNGGSAADAQHLATELTVRFRRNRRALAAIALTTDTSALTAIGNDFGFEHLFARQIEALGRPGDVAIGITTSGGSANVLAGLRQAAAMGLTGVGLTGASGLKDPALAAVTIRIPSSDTARIQEMHITIGHILCEILEYAVA